MEKPEFAIAEVLPGKLNALVKNLMRQMDITDPNEAVRRVNSGEWVLSYPTYSWRVQDGVIRFSVTSDGTTGPQWITRLEEQNFRVGNYAKSVLRHKDFQPTKAGTIHEIGVLEGEFFTDKERTTLNIRLKAVKNKMILPEAEVACLIREKFSDKDLEAMGLWWIAVMHEPIEDSDGDPSLLCVDRVGNGRWLDAYWGNPDDAWDRGFGFAFVVSQV